MHVNLWPVILIIVAITKGNKQHNVWCNSTVLINVSSARHKKGQSATPDPAKAETPRWIVCSFLRYSWSLLCLLWLSPRVSTCRKVIGREGREWVHATWESKINRGSFAPLSRANSQDITAKGKTVTRGSLTSCLELGANKGTNWFPFSQRTSCNKLIGIESTRLWWIVAA